MNGTFVHIKKISENNSSVKLRFEIFVMAFGVGNLFGSFEKRAPDVLFSIRWSQSPPPPS